MLRASSAARIMGAREDIGDRPPLAPERWTRICAALDKVSESTEVEREAGLAEACRGHQRERGEVERFLRCTPDEAFLEALPDDLLHEVFGASGDTDLVARFPPDTTLQDRYRVSAFLGSGGMGDVYLAQDLALGEQVALKFLSADIAR